MFVKDIALWYCFSRVDSFIKRTEFHHCQERAYNSLRRICTYHRARHFWWIRHARRCHRVDQINELRNQSKELLFGGDRPDRPSSLCLIMGSSVTLSRFFLNHPPTSFSIILLMMGPSSSIAFTLHFDQSDITLWSLASNLIIGELFPILSYLFRLSPHSLPDHYYADDGTFPQYCIYTLPCDQGFIKLWSLVSNLMIGELFSILSHLFRSSPHPLLNRFIDDGTFPQYLIYTLCFDQIVNKR